MQVFTNSFSLNEQHNRGFSIGIFERKEGIACPPDC